MFLLKDFSLSTGIATLILAPFGGYALNLAAIIAAICMGREALDSFWSKSFGDWFCFLGTGGWNIFSFDILN